MSRRVSGSIACLALLASGAGAAEEPDPAHLRVRGPGAVFASVEIAAVDALIHAYRQARDTHDRRRMRAGTIHPVEGGFSYGAIYVAGPLAPTRISYVLEPGDVARFQIYPRVDDPHARRVAERASRSDRRSVSFVDPLHRPLYILHPSLVIRVYRGADAEGVEVADLRRPPLELLLAGE